MVQFWYSIYKECEKMKKIMVAVIACLTLLLVTGCGSEQKTMKCSRSLNQSGAAFDLQYEVVYTGNYVDIVKSTETVTSDDTELLETYRSSVEELYAPYKDIEHYTYNVSVDGNVLTSKTEINYKEIDTSKMIEVDSANAQLIKDGKVKLDTVKSLYEQMRITCES